MILPVTFIGVVFNLCKPGSYLIVTSYLLCTTARHDSVPTPSKLYRGEDRAQHNTQELLTFPSMLSTEAENQIIIYSSLAFEVANPVYAFDRSSRPAERSSEF